MPTHPKTAVARLSQPGGDIGTGVPFLTQVGFGFGFCAKKSLNFFQSFLQKDLTVKPGLYIFVRYSELNNPGFGPQKFKAMLNERFKNAPEYKAVNHELVGKRIRKNVLGLKVECEAIAAYIDKNYEGKMDAHTAIVVKHEPINWGGQEYTESVLWLFTELDGRSNWYEVIE